MYLNGLQDRSDRSGPDDRVGLQSSLRSNRLDPFSSRNATSPRDKLSREDLGYSKSLINSDRIGALDRMNYPKTSDEFLLRDKEKILNGEKTGKFYGENDLRSLDLTSSRVRESADRSSRLGSILPRSTPRDEVPQRSARDLKSPRDLRSPRDLKSPREIEENFRGDVLLRSNSRLSEEIDRKEDADRSRRSILSLSQTTPRDELDHRSLRGLKSPREIREDGFRDDVSLRSSVRFNDQIDRKFYSPNEEGLYSNSKLPLNPNSSKSLSKSSLSYNRTDEYHKNLGDVPAVNRYERLSQISESQFGSVKTNGSPRSESLRSSSIMRDDHLSRLTALDHEEPSKLESRQRSSSSSVNSGIMRKHGKLNDVVSQNSPRFDHDRNLRSMSSIMTDHDSLKGSIPKNDPVVSRSLGNNLASSVLSRDVAGESLKLNLNSDDDLLTKFRDITSSHNAPHFRENREFDHFDLRKDHSSSTKSPRTPRSKSDDRQRTLPENASKSQNFARLGKVLDENITKNSASDRDRTLKSSHGDLNGSANSGRLQSSSHGRTLDFQDQRLQRPRDALAREGDDDDKRLLNKNGSDLAFRSRDLSLELATGDARRLDRDELFDRQSNSKERDWMKSQEPLNGDQRKAILLGSQSHRRLTDEEFREFKDDRGSKKLRNSSPFDDRSRSRLHSRLLADVTEAKYKIVKNMIKLAGFSIATEKHRDCDLIWNDSFVSLEKISQLETHQRINHFAGMGEICRLASLVKIISRMNTLHQNEYNFFPKSWVCPDDADSFQAHCKDMKKKGKKKVYIVKPIEKSKGNGVVLLSDAEKVPHSSQVVVQEYIEQPLLINRRKFHMRCFVLVTSCDPPRIFLFADGVVFLAGDPYEEASANNYGRRSAHVTGESGERCSLKGLLEKLHQTGVDVDRLWRIINDIIIKTFILVHPHLYQNYKLCRSLKSRTERESVCFEVLGFDFLVDRDMKPWLLKVTQSPNFNSSDNLELDVKSGVLEDTLNLITLSLHQKIPDRMTTEMAEKALANLNSSKVVDGRSGDKVKTEEKETTEEESKRQEIIRILDAIKTEAKSHRFGNNCGRFKQIFPHYDKNSLEKYSKLLEAAHIFISGPDAKRKQEVTQFLVQKEKDRLQAIIRSNAIANGELGSKGLNAVLIDIGPKLTERTLNALNATRITVPGKTEKATDVLLTKLRENWTTQKPKLAKFWFIHLDSNKKEKVINIVKNKVQSVANQTWSTSDVENVHLYRIFHRLFNRLLANHGKGLWDCFNSKRNNSWETIFVKGTNAITPTELSCCRSIVRMCCDCVCIAYICAPQQE